MTQSRHRHMIRGAVGLIAVGVGVARGVEPADRHPLAEPGRGQQAVDDLLVRVRAGVALERIDLGEGRRQAGQVERHAAEQDAALGLGRRREPLALQPGQDEGVDRVADPLLAADPGNRRALRRDERPVRLPLRPLGDPAADRLDLGAVRDLPDFGGGIRSSSILGGDPAVELAGVQVARDDRAAAVAIGPGRRLDDRAAGRPCAWPRRARGTGSSGPTGSAGCRG